MRAYSGTVTDHRVVVIGAGFAGIGMAIQLMGRGHDDLVILERSDRIGGVWRENTYPGAACDVPSHLYSYSFSQPVWSRRYSRQPEILAYLQDQVDRYGLGAHLRLGAGVECATWEADAAHWELALSDGSTLTASMVVSAVGQLTRPVLPDIPGRDLFTGASWHSAQWDHTQDLTAKRVAVIGTGTSAMQFVPEIAKQAQRVHVFQRSAPYVLPKIDHRYDGLTGAWHRVPLLARLDRLRIFLYGEMLTSAYVASDRMADYVTNQWRDHLSEQIDDPDLRAKAMPDYKVGCKRIGFSNDWYPALASDHVELVTDRVTAITAAGITSADGTERPVDVIIYGTGFGATEFLQPMEIIGRHGRNLQETWSAGAQAFAGVAVAGFPNFFMLYGPNSNLGANSVIYMLETQMAYVCEALAALDRDRLAWIDVRADVQAADNRWLDATSERTTYKSGCHSWYTTASGRNTNNWPTFTYRYRHKLRHLDLADFDVSPVPDPAPVAAPAGAQAVTG
ncbi:MAG: NAD(P)/FAD-dependent oxidoreductase [Actinomycetota bacterium]|nr:NAD(P)/FAD-dependent oxidoreductase [Actinomycetota bacterium]